MKIKNQQDLYKNKNYTGVLTIIIAVILNKINEKGWCNRLNTEETKAFYRLLSELSSSLDPYEDGMIGLEMIGRHQSTTKLKPRFNKFIKFIKSNSYKKEIIINSEEFITTPFISCSELAGLREGGHKGFFNVSNLPTDSGFINIVVTI